MSRILIFIGILIIGFIAGFNTGISRYKNLWDTSRQGLSKLNDSMASDDSQRLGILIITNKSCYATSSIENSYALFGGYADRETREILRQCYMDFSPYETKKT